MIQVAVSVPIQQGTATVVNEKTGVNLSIGINEIDLETSTEPKLLEIWGSSGDWLTKSYSIQKFLNVTWKIRISTGVAATNLTINWL